MKAKYDETKLSSAVGTNDIVAPEFIPVWKYVMRWLTDAMTFANLRFASEAKHSFANTSAQLKLR